MDAQAHGRPSRSGYCYPRKAIESRKSTGTVIHTYEIDQKQTLRRNNNKIFVVVPVSSELSVRERKVRAKTFLLAISEDEGMTFSFMDGDSLRDNQARMSIVPDLPQDLPLPSTDGFLLAKFVRSTSLAHRLPPPGIKRAMPVLQVAPEQSMDPALPGSWLRCNRADAPRQWPHHRC